MPTLEVTTKYSRSVWKSPDGQREIFEVTLESDNQELKAKTYSKDIGQVGWVGTVESYEKEGRNGAETFVKQPQKEGFQGGGSFGRQSSSRTAAPSKFSGDQFTMYLSYAKDIAVALLASKEGFSEEKYGVMLDAVALGGETLYEAHNAKPDDINHTPEQSSEQLTLDPPLDKEAIDKLFDEPGKEAAWNKKS